MKEDVAVEYKNKKVLIKEAPEDGDSLSVFVRPGDEIDFLIEGFDLDSLEYQLVGGDIVVIFPNGGMITFASMALMGYSATPPVLNFLQHSKSVSVDDILSQIEEVNELPIESVNASFRIKVSDTDEQTGVMNKSDEAPQIPIIIAQDTREYDEPEIKEEEFQGMYQSQSVSEAVPNPNTSTQTSSASNLAAGSSNVQDAAEATLRFDVGFYQTVADIQRSSDPLEPTLALGGGGSLLGYLDTSPQAQIEAHLLDMSDELKSAVIYADGPNYFGSEGEFISRVIRISPEQPEGFGVTSIAISGLSNDFEIVGGVRSGGVVTIAKENFLESDGNIEFLIKYPSNTTYSPFRLDFELTSEFSLDNVEEGKVIEQPDLMTLKVRDSVNIEVKEVLTAEDYVYTSQAGENGFVLNSNMNSNIIYTPQADSTVYGGTASDTIYGGLGDDLIEGGIGRNYYSGGAGDNMINAHVDGVDTLGYEFVDRLQATEALDVRDQISSDDFSYIISLIRSGIDINLADGLASGVTVDRTYFDAILNTPPASGADFARLMPTFNDTFVNINNVVATNYNDIIRGDANNNRLSGLAGDDSIFGIGGDNVIIGGDGNDYMEGGRGASSSRYQEDLDSLLDLSDITAPAMSIEDLYTYFSDFIDGGSGTNTVGFSGVQNVAGSSEGVTVALQTLDNGVSNEAGIAYGADTDVGVELLSNVQNIIGSNFNDKIIGSSESNVLSGLGGDDTISGVAGNNFIYGYKQGFSAREIYEMAQSGEIAADIDGVSYVDDRGVDGLFVRLNNDRDVLRVLDGRYTLYSDAIQSSDALSGFDISSVATEDIRTINENFLFDTDRNDPFYESTDNLLIGGSGNDEIFANKGNDTLIGGLGNNRLDGGSGVDTVLFEARGLDSVKVDLTNRQGAKYDVAGVLLGVDTLVNIEVVQGSSGSDTILGDENSNTLIGGLGSDTLSGRGGENYLYGGEAVVENGIVTSYDESATNDNWVTFFDANDGADVDLGRAQDQILLAGSASQVFNINNIIGSNIADTLVGNNNNNSILGGRGNDTLSGREGNNYLDGEDGVNTLDYAFYRESDASDANGLEIDLSQNTVNHGSFSDVIENFANLIGTKHTDTLTGNDQNNTIFSGLGDDTLIGSTGNDRLVGDVTSSDTVDYSSVNSTMIVDLATGEARGLGTDRLENINNARGGSGNDTLIGDNSDNELYGEGGDDTLKGNGGDNILDGGSGNNTVDYSWTSDGVEVNLATAPAQGSTLRADGSEDILENIQNIIGGTGDDILTGSDENNTITVSAGENTLEGKAGENLLIGGSGDDIFIGGSGRDDIRGGGGSNTLTYENITTSINANLSQNIATGDDIATDAITDIQTLIGSQSDDILIGNNSDNHLIGSRGDDTLYGGRGDNIIDGGDDATDSDRNMVDYSDYVDRVTVNLSVDDVLSGTTTVGASTAQRFGGGEGVDTLLNIQNIRGSARSDFLIGDTNNNTIYAVDGADVIKSVGSTLSGRNELYGGAGDATFLAGAGNDYIDGEGGSNTIDFSDFAATQGIAFSLQESSQRAAVFNGDDEQSVSSEFGLLEVLNVQNIIGTDFDDILEGKNNESTRIETGAGENTIFASSGNDTYIGNYSELNTLDYSNWSGSIVADLDAGTINGAASGFDEIDGFLRLIGSNANDTLVGHSSRDNILEANAGDNTLDGLGGDNTLIAGSGSDTLIAREGEDIFIGSATGGEDWVDYSNLTAPIALTLNSSGDAILEPSSSYSHTLTNIHHIIGTEANDTITGDSTAVNTIMGFAGENTLQGGMTQADVLIGGTGDDIFFASSGGDSIDGGEGHNVLRFDDVAQVDSAGVYLNANINRIFRDGFLDDISQSVNGRIENIQEIVGSNYDDTITGDSADNTLFANAGANTLAGGQGDDILYGGSGNDTLDGGDDNDTLYGVSGENRLVGGRGDNILYAGEGADTFIGGLGNDTFYANAAGRSILSYDELTSSIVAQRDTNNNDIIIQAGGATDRVVNATDDFTLFENAPWFAQQSQTTAFVDTIIGSASADILTGNNLSNTLWGGSGDDIIYGYAGDNYIVAGFIEDGDFKGTSNNTLVGGIGNDTIYGGLGNDTLIGGHGGANLLDGVAGNNTVDYSYKNIDTDYMESSSLDFRAIVNLGDAVTYRGETLEATTGKIFTENGTTPQATDTLSNIGTIIGAHFGSIMRGLDSSYEIIAQDGNDTIVMNTGGGSIDGGGGENLADFSLLSMATTVDLRNDEARNISGGSGFGTTTLENIQNIFASSNSDEIFGADGIDNTIWANAGNNRIEGIGGNNLLYGGTGNDDIRGGSGNDIINARYYIDLDGTEVATNGNNVLHFGGGDNIVIGGSGNDNIGLSSRSGGYGFINGAGDNTVFAGDGDDYIYGGSGNNILVGEGGEDRFFLHSGTNTIWGNYADDNIYSDVDIDSMVGGSLANTIDYQYFAGSVNVDLERAASGHQGTTEALDADDNIFTKDYFNDIQNIRGSQRDDVLIGSAADNVIAGGDGNDTIIGRGGENELSGNRGTDTFIGGTGSDTINGGRNDGGNLPRNALIYDSSDWEIELGDNVIDDAMIINLSAGVASYSTNAGWTSSNDPRSWSAVSSDDWYDTITDIRDLYLSDFGSIVIGNNHWNNIYGGSEEDTIYGGGGSNVLNGGADSDNVLTYEWATGAQELVVNLTNATRDGVASNRVRNDNGGTDTISNFKTVIGSSLDDTFWLSGGEYIIKGGDGDDLFNIISGNNDIDGELGENTLSYRNSSNAVKVNLTNATEDGVLSMSAQNGASDVDRLQNIRNVIGSNKSDTIWLGDMGHYAVGGIGNDTIYGGAGSDTIEGTSDNNLIYTGGGENSITGSAANDVIVIQESSSNAIDAGDGEDRVVIESRTDYTDIALAGEIVDGGDNIDTLAINDALTPLNDDAFYAQFINFEILDLATNQTIDLSGTNAQALSSSTLTLTDTENGSAAITLNAGNTAGYVEIGRLGDVTLTGANNHISLLDDIANHTIYMGAGEDTVIGSNMGNTFVYASGSDAVGDSIDGGGFLNTLRVIEEDKDLTGASLSNIYYLRLEDAIELTISATQGNGFGSIEGSSDNQIINVDFQAGETYSSLVNSPFAIQNINEINITGNELDNQIDIYMQANIDGGGGTNTLNIYWDLNLSTNTIENIQNINSTNSVTLDAAQLNSETITFSGSGDYQIIGDETQDIYNFENITHTGSGLMQLVVDNTLNLVGKDTSVINYYDVQNVALRLDKSVLNGNSVTVETNAGANVTINVDNTDAYDFSSVTREGSGNLILDVNANVDVKDDNINAINVIDVNTHELTIRDTQINILDELRGEASASVIVDVSQAVVNLGDIDVGSFAGSVGVSISDDTITNYQITGISTDNDTLFIDGENLVINAITDINRVDVNENSDFRASAISGVNEINIASTKTLNADIEQADGVNVAGAGSIILEMSSDSSANIAGVDVDTDQILNVIDTATFNANFGTFDVVVKTGEGDLTIASTATIANIESLTVESGAILTLDAAHADTLDITNNGTVNVLNLDATPDADLSLIIGTGTLNADWSGVGEQTFTGDIGVATTTVSSGTMILDDTAIVTNGEFVVDAPNRLSYNATKIPEVSVTTNNGAVDITNLQDDLDADLSAIPGLVNAEWTTGSAEFIGNLTDVDTLTIVDGTMSIADSILGTIATTGAGNIVVTADDASADLSNVDVDGTTTINTTAASDVIVGSANNDTINVSHAVSTINGGTGVDSIVVTNGSNIDFTDTTLTSIEILTTTGVATITDEQASAITTLDGVGALTVEIDTDSNVDLSHMDTTTKIVNVIADSEFSGEFASGTLIEIDDAATLTASYEKLDGLQIDKTGTTGAVDIEIANASANADLSTITGDADKTAIFTQTQTFTGSLNGVNAIINDGVVVTAAADRVTDETLNKEASGTGELHVTVLDAAGQRDADLNSINGDALNSVTIIETQTFTGVLHDTIETTVVSGVTFTLADTILGTKSVLGAGDAIITMSSGTNTADLSSLDVSGSETARFTATTDFSGGNLADVDVIEVTSGTLTLSGTQLHNQNYTLSGAGNIIINATGTVDLSNLTNNLSGTTTINDSTGADIITGTNGGDIINLSGGADEITLGSGEDSVNIQASNMTSSITIDGTVGAGVDTLNITSTGTAIDITNISGIEVVNLEDGGSNAITLGANNGTINGGDNADTFRVSIAHLTGAKTINGGAGSDTIEFLDAGTITADKFANVNSVENITLANGTNTLFFATKAEFDSFSFASVDASATGDDTIELATGTYSSSDFIKFNDFHTLKFSDLSDDTLEFSDLTSFSNFTDKFTLINGGTGNDTLRFTAAVNGTLDFSKYANFENLAFDNSGTNNLDFADVTAFSDLMAAFTITNLDSITFGANGDTLAFDAAAFGAGIRVVNLAGGDDSLTLESSLIANLDGAEFNGGAGSDTLTIDRVDLSNYSISSFENIILNEDADLSANIDSDVANITVAASKTLTLNATDFDDKTIAITANGDVVINATTTTNDHDFAGISKTGSGDITLIVDGDVSLVGKDLGDIDKIEVISGTLTLADTQLSGRVVSGAGSVVVEVNSDSSTDFSTALALDTAANETIEFRGDSTFDGNFGDANIVVSSGVTLTTTFDRLDGKTTALSGAGNITLSDTSVDAADANDVAGAISGVLSATVSPDTAANLNAALTDANATDALDIVITGTTAIASDLKELDAKTSLEIDAATNVETITGVAEDIQTVVEAAGIDTATNVNVVVDSGDATVVQQVAIDAQTTGVITATISNGDMASLNNITASDATHNLTITVTDTSVAASELIALDTKTNVAIQTAVDVDELTGTRENISTVINSATITTATDVNATVSGSMTSTQLATMDGITTGVITATISDNDMTALANLTNDNANNALTIIVTDASVDATALNTLTTKTSEVITATAVGTLTGTAAAVEDALTSSEVDLATDIAIDINSGTATVTEQIAIDAQTTGVITATISNGDMASLSDITASDATHNLTITVTDTSVAASELLTLDNKTSVAINALGVTTLSGTLAAINSVLSAAGIDTVTNSTLTVEISDSTLSAQELLDLEQESAVGTVDASSIDTISATVAQLNTLYGNTDIINLGDDTANITTAGTFAPTEFGNIESGDITTLNFSDSTDTLAFTDESSFDDFRAKFSTIDLGSSSDDTLSFSSAVGASGNLADLDFSNISDLENLDFSGSDDYISLSGDEPSNIDLGDGDDVVELSFSELSNFTIDGGVGSDRVNLTGDSQTVNDTDFANLANIEALDFEGSANNIIIDAATINDWLDGSGTFTIKGADDDTLNISTDDANYRWFDSSDSTWKDTDLNDVAPATYQIDTNNDDSANFTLEIEAS